MLVSGLSSSVVVVGSVGYGAWLVLGIGTQTRRRGEWFVDTTCIDCDAAPQVAPGLIARAPGGQLRCARPVRWVI